MPPPICIVILAGAILMASSALAFAPSASLKLSSPPFLPDMANRIRCPAPSPQDISRVKRAAQFWLASATIVKKYVAKHIELTLRENIMRQKLSDQERIDEWNQIHDIGSTKLHDTIRDMKGFYVKAAQIVSSRGDLFPSQYIDKLGRFTENLEPMSIDLVKEVVAQDLLPNGEDKFEDVFTEFDEIPLGSASIGQVHRAVLSAKYGGKEVAVKVQRPSIEEKLLGDVANLKAITKPLRGLDALPVDYYTIFCELEKQLANEFDFLGEAAAMTKFHHNLHHRASGAPDKIPLVMPLPVDGLVSKRVLTMDLLKGASLQQKFKEMEEKGIDSSSPEAKLFGRKLLRTLTDVFGRSILEHGFFHADAHPGNIWIHEDGSIGLIDFGQVKSISDTYRKTLAQAVLSIAPTEDDGADIEALWQLMHDLGIVVKDGAPREAGAALGMWMFDGSATTLPGNYDAHELSPKSPVRDIETFPEDLVLIARSSVLVKGMSSRLNVPWSLAKEWRQLAEDVVRGEESNPSHEKTSGKRRLAMKRLKQLGSSSVKKLPAPIRSRVASIVLKVVERRERK